EVYDVIGLYVAASLVFGPGACQQRILHEDLHGVASPRRGKADVVAVHRRGAAGGALVLRITYEPQPRVGPIRYVRKGAMQTLPVAGRNDQLTVLELDVRDAAPGGIVNLGHRFLSIVRAQLRLVR